jgi:heat shock protein HslJ
VRVFQGARVVGRSSRAPCLVVLFALCLAACGSGRAAESKALIPRDPGKLDGTDWVLVGTGDSDAVPASTTLRLRIEAGSASGNGPCNSFRLDFSHESDDVTTGKVAATARACSEPLMTAERKFFSDLEAVDTAHSESGHLVLSGPGDVRLTFERANEPAEKLSGRWDIVSVASGEALSGAVPGSKPTLDFGSQGRLTIATGCNTGSSTWSAHGQSVSITTPASTRKACADDLMTQEASIFAALPRAATVDVAHDSAFVLDRAGTTLLVLAGTS